MTPLAVSTQMASGLKTAIASAAYVSGADRMLAALAGRSREPLVLGYHRVVADFPAEAACCFPSMLVSRGMLERHLDWIAMRFHVVRLDELRTRAECGRERRPLAAITFDDGYRDVYEHAFPLLMRKGLPATVFVTTSHVGTPAVHPHDKLYLLLARAALRWRSFSDELLRVLRSLGLPLAPTTLTAAARSAGAALRTLLTMLPQRDVHRVIEALEAQQGLSGPTPIGFRSMTWDMLRDLSRCGIAIGSHTKTHTLLTNEDRARAADEISDSARALGDGLQQPPTAFSYPDGRFDAAVVGMVARAGYRVAVTTCRHRDATHPWLTVPRLMLWERSSIDTRGRFSPAVLSGQVSGLFDRAGACAQRHPA
jgi:peptidoglycan/xylan/chitin deacetylase (PgdA/CDA1 family)